MALADIRNELELLLAEQKSNPGVTGAAVAVRSGDETFELAHGIANINTGEAFRTDTAWLLGSVTKVLVTTVVLRLVERGAIALDAPVRRYLPEFGLVDSAAADSITVRMLLNHTNGIDADTFVPASVSGPQAHRSYVDALVARSVLFDPGCGIHYSNPGFVLAARLIESQTGLDFEQAMDRELFGPAGMATATSARHPTAGTAIGSYPDSTGRMRASTSFAMPDSCAGAGATTLVTLADMLAFGQVILNRGIACTGERILSTTSVVHAQEESYSLAVPHLPSVGLGWWRVPIADTVALWHGGGSPGGTSSFTVLPEHDTAIVSYVSGPDKLLHDRLHNTVIERTVRGRALSPEFDRSAGIDPNAAGTYRQFQFETNLEVLEERLVQRTRFLPHDEEHSRTLRGFVGGEPDLPPITYRSAGPGLFTPAAAPDSALEGFYGRFAILGLLAPAAGRPAGIFQRLRFEPRVRRTT
ncbi:serine hydrolase domain-containing protein [Tsukamurella asaccharolytica]|uniref:serine hydrolase domain-containing protein n=1 Tax=Tsukamurella asaccharolytica TaxID=2592067 RepID=UPI0013151040|nr:serine hydrolase domain-containing protein [Tsukamurella asaccharolytica]